jgi:hypothetical protein
MKSLIQTAIGLVFLILYFAALAAFGVGIFLLGVPEETARLLTCVLAMVIPIVIVEVRQNKHLKGSHG